jgi:uncharacterized protein
MKIVVILLAVLAAIWFFKASRRGAGSPQKPPTKTSANPDVPALDMVRCHFCEVHLPRPDAIEGKKGSYCSLEHQRRAEP